MLWTGWRLLLEGRSGLWLPNYKHVNATYNISMHYGASTGAAADYQQSFCPPIAGASGGSAARTAEQEEEAFDAAENVVATLFPAMQLMVDSPAVGACSRFVIETARADALSAVSATAAASAVAASDVWRRRCAAATRRLTLCQQQGLYFDVPPPVAVSTRCSSSDPFNFEDVLADGTPAVYVTPWCVAIDRARRVMYDVRLCSRNAGTRLTTAQQLVTSDCALVPQPLSLLVDPDSTPPPTTLDQRLRSDVAASDVVAWAESVSRQYVSGVVDWWPDDQVPMPVGYHVTSPLAPLDALAPVLFDSHYAFDSSRFLFGLSVCMLAIAALTLCVSSRTCTYVHSALRNSSLVHRALGAGGLCRAHSIAMPLFDANTNRICTRSPTGSWGMPHLPVSTHDPLVNILGAPPYDPTLLDEHFGPELCAPGKYWVLF